MIYINESTFCLSFALAEQSSVAASDMGRFIFIFAALQTLSKKLKCQNQRDVKVISHKAKQRSKNRLSQILANKLKC